MAFGLACALSACATAVGPDPEPFEETVEAPSVPQELEEAQRTPDLLLLLGTEYEARPAPTLEETQGRLMPGGEPSLLLEALIDGGLSEEEAVEMTHIVAAHNSGQPYDRVRIRADQWRLGLQGAVDTFEEELEQAEMERGVRVDRGELAREGVVLSFSEEDVR